MTRPDDIPPEVWEKTLAGQMEALGAAFRELGEVIWAQFAGIIQAIQRVVRKFE